MKKLLVLLLLPFFSCTKEENNPILFALYNDSEKIQNVINTLESHEVQIMVTDSDGNDFRFQVNDSTYFYPASSVKFPVAILALEKANRIAAIHSKTTFLLQEDSIQTTIRNEVQKIFAVSDNEAYNRLFEFLGQDEINERLREKNLNNITISHRLSTENAADLTSKSMVFLENDNIVYYQAVKKNNELKPLQLHSITKGKGFYRNDSLIHKPMDFSKKNYLSISTLHELMNRLQFPEKYDQHEQFQLSENDRDFLLKTMHQTPKQQGFTATKYYDSYVKFFMFGDTEKPMPADIKIYNKVGYAYGYLTDCAYIVDEKHNISFTITATIHVNANQVFNDDTYEYETIGIPFLAELGRQVHQFYINKQQK
jgi:beta-lactamase class A